MSYLGNSINDDDLDGDLVFPALNELHPIIENLDADDESDCSDADANENDVNINEVNRSRKASFTILPRFNGNNRQLNRRRKTSCNDVLPLSEKERMGGLFKSSEFSLPSITRSLSLPGRLEGREMKKAPSKGSRSATERLQLPGINEFRAPDSISDKNCNKNRNFFYLPSLGRKDNPKYDCRGKSKSDSLKSLDMFMRNNLH